jgi:hypothetical protein
MTLAMSTVNNRATPAGNHEATSRSRTLPDGGRNRVRREHQLTPNHSRALAMSSSIFGTVARERKSIA